MRFLIIVACLILSFSAVSVAFADKDQIAALEAGARSEPQKRRGLEIRVVGGGWGDARPEEIETVLNSVATILLEHFPGRRLNPILVAHSDEYPIIVYKKGPGNEYRVYLSAKDQHWPRYAYEFAHELSHILSNYDHHAYSKRTTYNQWFEETLSEVASLYALRRLASVWEVSPPHPHRAAYAREFERYAERFLGEQHRRLPPSTSLARWFAQNENELRDNPYLRCHNELVANLLLPLFEEYPAFWEAIGYLRLGAAGGDFREYMHAWRANAPEHHKDLIRYVMALFGILEGGKGTGTASLEAREAGHPGKPHHREASQGGLAGSTSR